MTYNVLDGGINRAERIVEVLRDISADVIVLQEVFDASFVRSIADALGMQYFVARGNSKYHLALLSRWPIVVRHSHHPFPPIQQTVLEAVNASAPGDSPVVRRLGILNRVCILLQGQRIYRCAIRTVLEAGMIDCFRALHPNADGFTYGPPAPVGRIDYIFASAALAPCLTKCFVVREPVTVDRASDHYPVVADFAL
jgi:exonuclease III